jgi:hypothetical protein
VDRCARRLCIRAARDVELDDQQVVGLADGVDDGAVSRPLATTASPAASAR